MKTERRHELQHNELADWLAGSLETAKPYSRALVGVCLAIVVIVGTSWFISSRAANKRAAGWNQFYEGWIGGSPEKLRETTEQHQGTPAAQWARVLLGDQEFEEGTRLLFTDRALAKDKLQRALDDYAAVLIASDDPLLLQRATFGAGKAQESLGDLEKARSAYKLVMDQWPDSPFADLAQERLDALDRQSTKDFYKWFAEFKPIPPKPPAKPEEPGLNMDDLPFMSDLPSFLEGDTPASKPTAQPADKATAQPADKGTAKPAGSSTAEGQPSTPPTKDDAGAASPK